MSQCIIQVVAIDKVRPHPNADLLEISEILGWQVVVQKGVFNTGDKIVYFPPDSCITLELGEQFGVAKYLKTAGIEGYGRVGKVKLRGEPSYGFACPAPDDVNIGDIVTEKYQAKKYLPPIKFGAADEDTPCEYFEKYTELENLRNFPGVFIPGEEVVIMEKINGTNSRVGFVNGEQMIGSRTTRRKIPADTSGNSTHKYFYPFTKDSVVSMFNGLSDYKVAVIFGEVYGQGVARKFHYGLNREIGYRAFDLYIDRYLNFDDFKSICEAHGIEIAPVLYRGPYDFEVVKELSKGKTTVSGDHIREGIVIKPTVERHDPRVGRVIMKYLSDDYLLGGFEDFTDI